MSFNDLGADGSRSTPQKISSVFFDRRELGLILSVYGRMVAAGSWRDYALDGLSDRCVFSVFQRSSEHPLYRIEKQPALARKQGAFSVIGAQGQILRRGHELEAVLRFFEKARFAVVRD